MISSQYPRRIALVGDYPPRKCGIATFSADVRHSLITQYPGIECTVLPVTDRPEGYDYPPEVRFEISQDDRDAYRRAADFINFGETEVVSLQHEFGIYGGRAGSHVLTLLRELRVPVVSHLHTVLARPGPMQRRVLKEIAALSARLIVMSEGGRELLSQVYGIAPERVDVIPHGIPDLPFVDPNFHKDHFGVEGRRVVLTFGLLAPSKGIEVMLRALPTIVREFPDVIYVVLGATHPAVVRTEGERYRRHLQRIVRSLRMDDHVAFHDRFVAIEELKKFLGAADIYVTPYLGSEQITSGTLSYAFGCGKAVVSTPYRHAEELLADGRGVLVPFRDSEALGRAIVDLLRDEVRRHAMRKQAYLLGRAMTWSNVAHQFMESYQRARLGSARAQVSQPSAEVPAYPLMPQQLTHLQRLTDGVGLLHNATYAVPDYTPGYRTTDNAQALRLTVLCAAAGDLRPELARLQATYAAFVHHAFVSATGRFHGHLSFDRRWVEDGDDDETLGTAIWALGTCVGRAPAVAMRRWAVQLLDRAFPALMSTTTPRAWALGLLGLHEYLRRLRGDRVAEDLRAALTQRLLAALARHEATQWPWFEPRLSEGSAQLPHALLLGAEAIGDATAAELGMRTLRWLMDLQTTAAGHFHAGLPLAKRTSTPPDQYDQFPRQAASAVAACVEAARQTGDPHWEHEARRAFEWFLGRNELGQPLYDPSTGGCCDALQVDRVNLNQGAVSTLAYCDARYEMSSLSLVSASPQLLPAPADRSAPCVA